MFRTTARTPERTACNPMTKQHISDSLGGWYLRQLPLKYLAYVLTALQLPFSSGQVAAFCSDKLTAADLAAFCSQSFPIGCDEKRASLGQAQTTTERA